MKQWCGRNSAARNIFSTGCAPCDFDSCSRARSPSRGFGFVEMADDGAREAQQALDGKDFGGRPLRVDEARERGR